MLQILTLPAGRVGGIYLGLYCGDPPVITSRQGLSTAGWLLLWTFWATLSCETLPWFHCDREGYGIQVVKINPPALEYIRYKTYTIFAVLNIVTSTIYVILPIYDSLKNQPDFVVIQAGIILNCAADKLFLSI